MKPVSGVNPIPIILTSYMRPHLLRRVVGLINERTLYPYRIIVVHNSPEDFEDPVNRKAADLIKRLKVTGEIADFVFTMANLGQAGAQNEGMKYVERHMPNAEYVVMTQDDLAPPNFRPCWLQRMVKLIDDSPDYGAISMRIERTARLDWDEKEDCELLTNYKSVPAVFRIHRMEDIRAMGPDPFTGVRHWESQLAARLMEKIGKKQAMATHVYASHWGYSEHNKGYLGEFRDYYTYSPERVDQAKHKPYPEIHPETNEPVPNQEYRHDIDEFRRRNRYWNEHIGLQEEGVSLKGRRAAARDFLRAEMEASPGRWADMGCGRVKFHEDALGFDAWPYEGVDFVHDVFDPWFVEDGWLDGIAASHILEHCKRPIKDALREWDRILKVGGTLAVIVPDGENRPSTIVEPSHNYAFTAPVMKELFSRVMGYSVLKLENLAGCPDNKRDIALVARKRR